MAETAVKAAKTATQIFIRVKAEKAFAASIYLEPFAQLAQELPTTQTG